MMLAECSCLWKCGPHTVLCTTFESRFLYRHFMTTGILFTLLLLLVLWRWIVFHTIDRSFNGTTSGHGWLIIHLHYARSSGDFSLQDPRISDRRLRYIATSFHRRVSCCSFERCDFPIAATDRPLSVASRESRYRLLYVASTELPSVASCDRTLDVF